MEDCVTSGVRELYYTKLNVSEGRRLLDRIAAGTGARVYLCTEKVLARSAIRTLIKVCWPFWEAAAGC